MLGQSYKAAIYCRLSREDGNEESQSIQSQKEILIKYVNDQGWDLVDIYCDDGYSGTNYDRPSFKRLINDIEYGRINLVITKDLSRLGRNYIQTGYYTEEFFPMNNVRYIALNDNFDTFKDDNDFAPFKNIINEWYAKDISKKVRFTLDNQAKNGEPRNTVFPIFGYKYNDNYERIPDPETAPIVQMIFEEYVKCASSSKVAKLLIDRKVKLPMYYNAIKYNYNKAHVLSLTEEQITHWTPGGVRDILKRVEYLGTYITARSKSKSFKLKKRDRLYEGAHFFENRYEPIVTKELFDKAQSLLSRGHSGQVELEVNLYKNMIICDCCGKLTRFQRWQNKKKTDIQLRHYCYNKECEHRASIYLKTLNQLILLELNELKDVILNNEEEFMRLADTFDTKGRVLNTNDETELKNYLKRSKELDLLITKLFEQNVSGLIPESTYTAMMDKYSKEKKLVEESIRNLTRDEHQNMKKTQYKNNASYLIEKLKQIEFNELTPELLREFIDSIRVKKIPNVKKEIEVTIVYRNVDVVIKEFLKNERHSSNLC